MADPTQKAENALSAVMRMGISLILPLWALAMIVLGITQGNLWWMGSGLVTGVAGLIMMVGNPLADGVLRDR
ncbi:MAG TPA: hypothetical protein VEF03_12630 [Candidatus Binataceae bacterium]|nr:hypothetical protein [Candidatus Binataceae bacterium]